MITFKTQRIPEYNATLVSFELDDGVTTPEEAFGTKLPEVPLDGGVIISGRGPIWMYARMIHHYHESRWVAVHDSRLGYVITKRHFADRNPVRVLKAISALPNKR
jgi:CRISPR-associated protein Csx3